MRRIRGGRCRLIRTFVHLADGTFPRQRSLRTSGSLLSRRRSTRSARFDCECCGRLDCLNGVDGGRFGGGFWSGFWPGLWLGFEYGVVVLILHHALDQAGDAAFVFGGFGYFGAWGEDA